MKVGMECYICLLERAIRAAMMITNDNNLILKVANRIASFLVDNFNLDAVPAILGTQRERIIMETLGVDDLYREIKIKSNEVARNVAEEVFGSLSYDDYSYENFRKFMVLAAAANSMEWFIRGHEFSLDMFKEKMLGAMENLVIDESRGLYELIKGKRVLYILDNAGEAVIDLYVVKYLRGMVKSITMAARSKPILNDVTVDELIKLGAEEYCDNIVAVGDFVGVIFEWATDEFKEAFDKSELVIAKGMGAYESITEYKLDKPTYVILTAKCMRIARDLGVQQGKLVIKRIA